MERFLNRLERGFLLVDNEGKVVFVNEYLIRKDLVSEEWKGKRYYEALRNLDLIRIVHDTFAESKGQEHTFTHREEWFRAVSLFDGEVFMEVNPISEAVRTEEKAREFLANATHELKTPLAVIKGVLETLYEEEEEGNKRDMILKALKRTENLINVVESLYMLISLERGGVKNIRPLNLREVIEEVLSELGNEIRIKGINVELEVPEDFRVEADPDKFFLMVKNIVDNAVRYNVEGGKVWIRAYTRDGRKVIEVEDTGKGIGPRQIPLIFEPFFRSSEERGLGIGLAISRRIAEFHGGKIEVESELGKGSLFRIVL